MLMVRFPRENGRFWPHKNSWKCPQMSLKISTGVNPTVVFCLAALLVIKTNNVTSRSFLTNWFHFFKRFRFHYYDRKINAVMIWRFYRPENVPSVGVFVSHWSNGGIKLSNAVKHKESGTTEADGSQEQPAGLQQQSNNNNLKRFSLICEHFSFAAVASLKTKPERRWDSSQTWAMIRLLHPILLSSVSQCL